MNDKRAPGRPVLPAERAYTGVARARVTPDQEAKFAALGGAVWLRKAIDRARLPKK